MGIFLLLLLLLFGLIQLSAVQTKIAQKTAEHFSKELNTRIGIGKVDISFFDEVTLSNVIIYEQATVKNPDTLVYLGKVNVKLNNLFFLKDSIRIYRLEASQIYVNARRTEKQWNYDFISDYFGGQKKTETTTASKQIIIQPEKIHLNQLRLYQRDGWYGEDMLVNSDNLEIDFEELNLTNHKLSVKKISMMTPEFSYRDYPGNPKRKKMATVPVVTRQQVDSSADWIVSVKNVEIQEGSFEYQQDTERPIYADHFDEKHLRFENLTGIFKNISYVKDSLSADVQFATKERCGFQINNLRSRIVFTPHKMEFNELNIQTPQSRIGNYYCMRFDDFQDDMQDYINKVRMQGRIVNSIVHTDDIGYFAPELKEFHRRIEMSGEADGIVENLKCKNLQLHSGATKIAGALNIKSATDLSKFHIEFQTEGSETDKDEINSFYTIKDEELNSILKNCGNLRFAGNFQGTLSNYQIKGDIKTALGELSTNIHTKNNNTIDGEITTQSFAAGKLLNNSKLGNLQANVLLKYEPTGKLFIDGKIGELTWDGYAYKKIETNGIYEDNQFKGFIKADDPHFKMSEWNGSITIVPPYEMNFEAEIEKADLKALHFIETDLVTGGHLVMKSKGVTPDEWQGKLNIRNAVLQQRESELVKINQLSIESESDNENNRNLTLTSELFDAEILGKYQLTELPDVLKKIMHHYYPNSIDAPSMKTDDAVFTYRLQTKKAAPLLQQISKRIREGNDAQLSGSVDTKEKTFTLNGKIPKLIIDGKTIKDILIEEKGDSSKLLSHITTEDISLSDSFHLPGAELNVVSANDSSVIQLKTGASNTLNQAELNAGFQGYSNGFKLHFFPSTCFINDKKWTLEKDGEFILRNDLIKINDIRFVQADQSLRITTELDEESNKQHIIAILENLQIGDFLPLSVNVPKLNAKVSGKVMITDPLGNLKAETELKARALTVDDRQVGDVSIHADFDKESMKLTYQAVGDDTIRKLAFKGELDLLDTMHRKIQSSFESTSLDLSILSPYLSDIFDEINGQASTSFTIAGELEAPDITGSIIVNKATLKVGFTKCRYFLDNQKIILEKDRISFPDVTIKDSLNRTGKLTGNIKHKKFSNIYFDELQVNSPYISLLNTTQRDNRNFYGNVTGNASISLEGPLNDLKIYIDGEPAIQDTSHVYISGSDEKESSSTDYIEFVNLNEVIKTNELHSKNNFTVNLLIRANPSCKVDVVIDEATGDVIKGEGKGLLNVRLGSVQPLHIQGSYELTRGDYTFNFQTFLKKPFTLRKGIINWNGNPLDANIDIQAEYLAKNLDISSLTTSADFQNKEDIKIISRLTGVLKNPNVKFDLELPEGSSLRRDEVVVKRLAEFKNDDNEMNKQVASLLLFNTFLTGNTNLISQGNANTLISNTIGGAVSSLLTNMLNRELQKATRGVLSTYIDINPTLDLQRSLSQLQANIRAGLRISLSNRLVVLLGGNLDYNNPLYTQQLDRRGLLTPDITVEWMINRDGTLRVVGFNRTNLDISLNQRRQSGLQLGYRKDVDNLSDIFKSEKLKNKQD